MITVKRGSTCEFIIALSDESGTPYLLGETDILIFGVKNNPSQTTYDLVKELTASDYNAGQGGYLVTLLPEDTECLYGNHYKYDFGIQKGNGEFIPACDVDDFYIESTVTKKKKV